MSYGRGHLCRRGEWESKWLAFSESVKGCKPGDGIETDVREEWDEAWPHY